MNKIKIKLLQDIQAYINLAEYSRLLLIQSRSTANEAVRTRFSISFNKTFWKNYVRVITALERAISKLKAIHAIMSAVDGTSRQFNLAEMSQVATDLQAILDHGDVLKLPTSIRPLHWKMYIVPACLVVVKAAIISGLVSKLNKARITRDFSTITLSSLVQSAGLDVMPLLKSMEDCSGLRTEPYLVKSNNLTLSDNAIASVDLMTFKCLIKSKALYSDFCRMFVAIPVNSVIKLWQPDLSEDSVKDAIVNASTADNANKVAVSSYITSEPSMEIAGDSVFLYFKVSKKVFEALKAEDTEFLNRCPLFKTIVIAPRVPAVWDLKVEVPKSLSIADIPSKKESLMEGAIKAKYAELVSAESLKYESIVKNSLKIELGKLDEALKPLSLISMDPAMQAVLRSLRDKVSS